MIGAMMAAAVMALLGKPIILNIGNTHKTAYNDEKLITEAKLRTFVMINLCFFVLSEFRKCAHRVWPLSRKNVGLQLAYK